MKNIISTFLFIAIIIAAFGQDNTVIIERYYYNTADSLQKIKEYNEAIVYYTKAIEYSAENSDIKLSAYLSRGVCKMQLENHLGAIDDFSRGIEITITNSDIYHRSQFIKITLRTRGLCHFFRGEEYLYVVFPSSKDSYDLEKACLDFSKAGDLADESIRKEAYDLIKEYCN